MYTKPPENFRRAFLQRSLVVWNSTRKTEDMGSTLFFFHKKFQVLAKNALLGRWHHEVWAVSSKRPSDPLGSYLWHLRNGAEPS